MYVEERNVNVTHESLNTLAHIHRHTRTHTPVVRCHRPMPPSPFPLKFKRFYPPVCPIPPTPSKPHSLTRCLPPAPQGYQSGSMYPPQKPGSAPSPGPPGPPGPPTPASYPGPRRHPDFEKTQPPGECWRGTVRCAGVVDCLFVLCDYVCND